MPTTTPGETGNLPLEVTSFVGRRQELTEAKRLLSKARLLTLTGAGGVGKTRLALKVAANVRRAFDDGVWLVELGQLHDPALVPNSVAATLGLREQSGLPVMTILKSYLAARTLLLVLDNCEHMVDECVELAHALLLAGPDLRILATSRERLGVPGEVTLLVPALSIPDGTPPPHLGDMARFEAVSLFADRAAAMAPDFVLSEENRIAVTEICHQLEGLPLAIELAAPWVRALSAHAISSRLNRSVPALANGAARGRSLRACVEWSYELCSRQERTLWARLAVFAGGFELDAAEGICAGDGLAPEDILDVLTSLVDKSIVIRVRSGTVARFRMLETIREFGQERLPDGDRRGRSRGRGEGQREPGGDADDQRPQR